MGYEASSKDSCSYTYSSGKNSCSKDSCDNSSLSYSSYSPTTSASKTFLELSKAIDKRDSIEKQIILKRKELDVIDSKIETLSHKLQEDPNFTKLMSKFLGQNLTLR